MYDSEYPGYTRVPPLIRTGTQEQYPTNLPDRVSFNRGYAMSFFSAKNRSPVFHDMSSLLAVLSVYTLDHRFHDQRSLARALLLCEKLQSSFS